MDTENLILRLGADVKPADSRFVTQRLFVALAIGSGLALLLLLFWQGLNPDLGNALKHRFFWMKAGYCLALGAPALLSVSRLARPDGETPQIALSFAVPIVLVAGIAAVELVLTPSSQWLAMWLGHSWSLCPWRVLALSGPIFLALLWAFRAFAPTQLRLSGAWAGVSAGALGAMVYGLHCPESSALFLLTWYSLGIGLAAAVGALLGPRLLRW